MCPSNSVGWNVRLNWEKPAHRLQAGRGEHQGSGVILSIWEVGYQGVSKIHNKKPGHRGKERGALDQQKI